MFEFGTVKLFLMLLERFTIIQIVHKGRISEIEKSSWLSS